jgi:hypothetical protein
MTKVVKSVSSLNFATFLHSIASNGKKIETRTNVFKDFEFSNSMQMYLSSMIKKEVHQRQIIKEKRN